MRLRAFYLPKQNWAPHCALTGGEARHAQVLRLRKDEKILLMDGLGKTAVAIIRDFTRRDVQLEIEREWLTPEPESRPIIAIALSKAARRGFFLEKAAELGAWAIWLWQAERSQGEINAKLADSCREQIKAGALQCHNPWFPELIILRRVESLAEKAASAPWRLLPWEDLTGQPVISLKQLGRPGDTVYAIGPEGGFAEKEVAILREAAFTTVSLGSRALRCETAATLCLGLHWWASQLPDKVI